MQLWCVVLVCKFVVCSYWLLVCDLRACDSSLLIVVLRGDGGDRRRVSTTRKGGFRREGPNQGMDKKYAINFIANL